MTVAIDCQTKCFTPRMHTHTRRAALPFLLDFYFAWVWVAFPSATRNDFRKKIKKTNRGRERGREKKSEKLSTCQLHTLLTCIYFTNWDLICWLHTRVCAKRINFYSSGRSSMVFNVLVVVGGGSVGVVKLMRQCVCVVWTSTRDDVVEGNERRIENTNTRHSMLQSWYLSWLNGHN